jgi:hypothetical protein
MRWVGHEKRMGEMRNAHKTLVGNREGKMSLGGPKRKWEDNIKMDLEAKSNMRLRTGFIWLRIGTSGRIWLKR